MQTNFTATWKIAQAWINYSSINIPFYGWCFMDALINVCAVHLYDTCIYKIHRAHWHSVLYRELFAVARMHISNRVKLLPLMLPKQTKWFSFSTKYPSVYLCAALIIPHANPCPHLCALKFNENHDLWAYVIRVN